MVMGRHDSTPVRCRNTRSNLGDNMKQENTEAKMQLIQQSNSGRETTVEGAMTSSRRDFLKAAGTAAATMVLPMAWASPAAGQSGEFKANNKLKNRKLGG